MSDATSSLVLTTPAALRARLASARGEGRAIGLVPTMGALHEGHLSLVDAAQRECGLCVVSIFVNPTQFGPAEDFTRYPRTLEADCKLLAGRGVDVVYSPTVETMYGGDYATYVEPMGPALVLEGQFRPGHFRGVATVVLKLFGLVQPDRAYFGQKDFQQSLVVRRMVRDLDLPIQVIVCPTVREADGLAMSSRNRYLSADERRRALSIHRSLRLARQMVSEGTTDALAIRDQMTESLLAEDLKIDYVAIADPQTLDPLKVVKGPAVALVAARVGMTRLIDNEFLTFEAASGSPSDSAL